jgi:hypothetical protein
VGRFLRPLVLGAAVLVVVGVIVAMTGGSRVAASLILALAILCAFAVLRAGGGPGRY